jgi:hypothetical protein
MLEQARGATRAWLAAVGDGGQLARQSRNQKSEFFPFGHLNLFRISNFVLRI